MLMSHFSDFLLQLVEVHLHICQITIIKTQETGLLVLVVLSAMALTMACGVGTSAIPLRVRIGASVAVFLLITSKTGVWGRSASQI